MQLLDRYQIQARVAPTLIVFSPLILATLLALLGSFGPLPISLFGFGMIAVAALAVLYALSFWIQHLGKEKEGGLWAGWGGAPTTRMLRWRDQTLANEKKRRMHEKAQQISGVTLLSEVEERERPEEADRLIEQAVAQVRRSVRRNDPDNLSSVHNAEYGFCRNWLGGRVLWVSTSVLGALACGCLWLFYERDGWFVAGFAVSAAFVPAAFVVGWRLLPEFTRKAADRYADSLLGSFLDQPGAEER